MQRINRDIQKRTEPKTLQKERLSNCNSSWIASVCQFLLSKYQLTTFHRCTSCKIEKPEYTTPRCRLWNRDMAATLNFRHILNNLRIFGKRPERFTRAAAGTTKRPASPSFGIKN